MEAEKFQLVVVTPASKPADVEVTFVSAPGSEGEFGVLKGHTEFLTTLKPGVIRYETEDGEFFLSVSWGYAEVKGESVTILAETSERAEDIDMDRAKKDLEHWQKELSALSPDDENYQKYQLKLERAQARLDTVNQLQSK
ncbi:MAG: F0F1 ATP synthase subunit epsilon [Nitrospinota bacterium]|nr:F0F1 ATP synthase subunit epsilon [Nitrospinota bacterium]